MCSSVITRHKGPIFDDRPERSELSGKEFVVTRLVSVLSPKMDNDDKQIGDILSRREAILRGGAAGVGLFGAALGAQAQEHGASDRNVQDRTINLYATPALTEGPFFEDWNIQRSNLLEGTTRPEVINGLPLTLQIGMIRIKNGTYSPVVGAKIDAWHCDAVGAYSDEPSPPNVVNTVGQNWLRGYQLTNAQGMVEFKTIYPGWYPGRAVHIHFKVRTYNPANQLVYQFTSQWFFDDSLSDQIMTTAPYSAHPGVRRRNNQDGIFNQIQADGSTAGSHLMLNLSPNPKGGYLGSYSIALIMP